MKKTYYGNLSKILLILLAFAFLSEHALAQISISGRIISDHEEEGLPGVNILIKGTTQGTVSDLEGRYTINAPSSESVLVFTYIGYNSEEITVGNRTQINVNLVPDITALEEVVVVGYGTSRKKDLIGSIATVSSDDFQRVPAANPLDVLAGRAAGLNITSSSGMPGAGSNVLIRGIQSIDGTNSPIYVIDGLITDGINTLSPNDIESVSVLKDASAAAIYGARAANGVILVTTKRGKGQVKPSITFNSFVGIQKESNLRVKVLNADEFIEIFNEAYENPGQAKPWTDADLEQYEGVDTDWKSLILRNGVIQNYELSLAGGNEKSNYYISGGYKDNKAMILGLDFKKYTLVLNTDHTINKWLKFGNSLNLYATESNGMTVGSNGIGSLGETYWQGALTSVPIKRAYEDDGDWGIIRNINLEDRGNPLYALQRNEDNIKNYGLMGNLYVTIEPVKGISFTTRQSLELDNRLYTDFNSSIDQKYGYGGSLINQISKQQRQTLHTITDFLFNVDKEIADQHSFNVLLGYSIEEWQRETLEATRPGTPNNSIRYVSAGDQSQATNENEFNDWAFLSMFGRLNYNFKEKYLFGATIRRDGTSRLLEANRYGVFPSLSLGWRISREAFLSGVNFIDDLKIRGSYGSLGNVQTLGNYATIAALNAHPYAANQQITPGYTFSSAINDQLVWETTLKKNIGLDASVLNNKIYTSIDFFIEDTEDLILRRNIPLTAGKTNNPFFNAGKIRNTGLEVELGYTKVAGDWNFDFNGNWSTNKNEILDLGGIDLRSQGNVEGYPVNSFFGYNTSGIIYDEETLTTFPHLSGKGVGDIMILDINGKDENGNIINQPDGKVDADDRTIIGRRYPKFLYGFMGSVGYKNWSLQLQLQGVNGVDRDISTGNDYGLMHYFQRWALNHDRMILDRYHPTKNPDGQMPQVDITDSGKNRETSDFWLRDASFLRVKNINLNYNFPKEITDRLNMGGLGVYVSIQNLHTFTDFPGAEVDTQIDPISGIPQPRTWTLGLRANF